MRRPGSRVGGPRPAVVIWVASVAAAVVTSGIQGIAPAIPAIQDTFSLNTFQVGLLTSVYLLPGVFSAFAAGLLAERIGDRRVLVAGLVLFGLGGVLLMFANGLATLLVVRFCQGIAFGAVLSLTVGIIGTVAPAGTAAHRGQSRRIIAMAVAEAIFPVLGGLLLALAWYAPFALQILALPVAAVAWFVLPAGSRPRRRRGGPAPVGSVWQAPAIVGVQTLAATRFLFKFAVLTYAPVVAVDLVGMSPVELGYLMGISAAVAAVTAYLSERLARRWRSSEMILACLLVIAVSLLLIGSANAAAVVAIGILLYGVQDGVYGVAHNVLANEMAPPGARMAYVGLTGTVRNVGKFLSPLLFGAVTLVLSVPQAFFTFAGLSLATTAVARRVAIAQRRPEPTAEPGETDGGPTRADE